MARETERGGEGKTLKKKTVRGRVKTPDTVSYTRPFKTSLNYV